MEDQAEINRMVLSKDAKERRKAAEHLDFSFANLPDKKQAWSDLHRLTSDNDSNVRWRATNAIASALPYVLDKNQAWLDIQRLASENEYSSLRRSAAYVLSFAFSYISDKDKAISILHLLASDKDVYVRAQAYHSLGRISISEAVDSENEEDFKKYLEEAINYFEKASLERTYSNPAKFCFPFYRSFYAICINKQWTEASIQKYRTEAIKAVARTSSEKKLQGAIDNLANALKDVQNSCGKDFKDVKIDLNAYKRYCERAADMLDATEEKTVTKELPIIDELIKGILGEIEKKAKTLCKQVKNTDYKEMGQQANDVGQELSRVIDPIRLEKEVNHMLIPISAICSKIPEEDRGEACEILKQINAEQNVEDKLPLISMFLSKISTQMNPKKAEIEAILDKWGFGTESCGKRDEKRKDIKMWLGRFKPSECDDAFLILNKVKYYNSYEIKAFIEGLSKEIKYIFGEKLPNVRFYPLGNSPASSGGNFLYAYNKELGLSENNFPYTPFNEIDLSDIYALVFFDDIIGSGNQAIRFAKKNLQKIPVKKYYFALLAFEKGYNNVKESKYFENVVAHEISSDEYKCFSPNSQVFPDKETRERIEKLCRKYGEKLYDYPLGYDNSQALIVFPHNTPNNTLPIIWASVNNEKKQGYIWYPLWERIKKK